MSAGGREGQRGRGLQVAGEYKSDEDDGTNGALRLWPLPLTWSGSCGNIGGGGGGDTLGCEEREDEVLPVLLYGTRQHPRMGWIMG